MRLLIIRHGDPDYERDALTPRGQQEAALLAYRLAGEGLTAVYCSPLGRAQETAAPTLAACGLTAETLPWLKEFSLPIRPDFAPEGYCPWCLPPSCWAQMDGVFDKENWRQIPLYRDSGIPERFDEIGAAFDALMARHGYVRNGRGFSVLPGYEGDAQTVALFCHYGLGNLLLAYITSTSLPLWWHQTFLPTSSVSMLCMEKHPMEKNYALLRVCAIGDTSHLYAGGLTISANGLHSPLR